MYCTALVWIAGLINWKVVEYVKQKAKTTQKILAAKQLCHLILLCWRTADLVNNIYKAKLIFIWASLIQQSCWESTTVSQSLYCAAVGVCPSQSSLSTHCTHSRSLPWANTRRFNSGLCAEETHSHFSSALILSPEESTVTHFAFLTVREGFSLFQNIFQTYNGSFVTESVLLPGHLARATCGVLCVS